MEEIKSIMINKNRGWRGLAEVKAYNESKELITSMIFSFSQPMWDDLIRGYIVLQDADNYIVLKFDNTESLPKGQRSVLLKYFMANVVNINTYPKTGWVRPSLKSGEYNLISHFVTNKNNHTTSDWNCIGIRVVP